MRDSSLIGHAIELYTAFAAHPERPADNVARFFFSDRKYLGAKDRRFISEVFFGTVRHWIRLEAIASDAFGSDKVPKPLLIAAYLVVLGGTPAQEVHKTMLEVPEELGGRFTPEVIDALADREREEKRLSALNIDARLAVLHSFPEWFVRKLRADYGEETESILKSLNEDAPTVLRANRLVVSSREALAPTLEQEGCPTTLSLLADDALILPKRVNVGSMPSFKRGAFEIQDEASQLVSPLALQASTASKSPKVLDACAGAGGKTLHLAALLENRGEIYATDVDGRKLDELKRRVKRSGAQNVRIVGPEEKEKRLGGSKSSWFDVVLLDVPCSGTGTLRRNPGIKWVLTEQMLSELIEKQRSILEEHARFVKPGGALVYATCALLKAEGEEQIEWFMNQHPNEYTVEASMRTRPDKEGCDGFFAARLRRET
jgi:16S rRNA (cytosine967-C5)-methyltransferase